MKKPKIKKLKWRWDYGVYMSFCPYCDEIAYEKDHCVFCGKPFKYVEPKYKETIVEVDGYVVVQTTNNNIHIYKDGRLISHAICYKKLSEDELKEQVEHLKNILNM